MFMVTKLQAAESRQAGKKFAHESLMRNLKMLLQGPGPGME